MERMNYVEKSSYYWEDTPIINKSNKVNTDSKYNMVDLCCGAGGISKGFEMTNKFEVLLGVDIYKSAMETFQENHPNASTILGDITKITNDMYSEVIGDEKVDIVTAGVPCQGFSLSNKKRNINDERNYLFLEVIRFVDLFSPDVVLIENVGGMKTYNNGGFVKEIEQALEMAGEGYTVKSTILNAADFGVPQTRKRIIFVAVKNNKSAVDFKFPLPTHGSESEKKYNTIRDAIGDLPFIEAGEEAKEYDKSPTRDYQTLMRSKANILYNHVAPKHPQSTINNIAETKPGTPMYERYKQRIRLDWDILSPTQLAGGIRPQFQFGHPQCARGLTVRERARIQSFPDDFVFFGGTVQGRVQTGNAVPPLLAKALAKSINEYLEKLTLKPFEVGQ